MSETGKTTRPKREKPDLLQYERPLWAAGLRHIAGIDEAGRGPLAGPVAAACVVLDPANIPQGINDSKKLSEKKRDMLFDLIMTHALAVGVGLVEAEEIDRINIRQAALKAMRIAVEKIHLRPDCLLIDGKDVLHIHPQELPIIGGDAASASIGAASIIAKVTRDRIMLAYDEKHPEYGFARHKGYGTQEHIAALLECKDSPVHRRTFTASIHKRGTYKREQP